MNLFGSLIYFTYICRMKTDIQKKERQKLYDARPERKAARALTTKIWRANNPDKVAAMSARKRAKKKTTFYSLYYLPEMHYIGVTNQLQVRMWNHNCLGRITEGYEVICTFETKREALDAERFIQDTYGYNGKNKIYK